MAALLKVRSVYLSLRQPSQGLITNMSLTLYLRQLERSLSSCNQHTYRTGFFNVGVSSQKFLGADGEMIELFLGNDVQPILGSINRRANTNGVPRIMGGTGLRNWFNENASVSDNISVEVLSPTAIRLRSNNG